MNERIRELAEQKEYLYTFNGTCYHITSSSILGADSIVKNNGFNPLHAIVSFDMARYKTFQVEQNESFIDKFGERHEVFIKKNIFEKDSDGSFVYAAGKYVSLDDINTLK
jgi:hypothetical protein